MRYAGGKGGAGVFQTIVNLIPPHTRYFEMFAGGANVWERKAPASLSVLVEKDPTQAAVLASVAAGGARSQSTVVLQRCALEALERWAFAPGDFVYLDPPYVRSTRRSSADLYPCELTDDDHRRLLAALAELRIPFILSGYRSALYDDAAASAGWTRIDFRAMTRRGPRIESVWLNYAPPATLAEFGYAGSDFRERERIKRKILRWRTRLAAMEPIERAAMMAALDNRE